MHFDCKEDIIQCSPLWKGERFPNGRPKVSEEILRRIAKTTVEEMWAPLYRLNYKFQFEGRLKRANLQKMVMVGRAVTAVFAPIRPDLGDYLMEFGRNVEGRKGFFNQWPLEDLQEHDIMVMDMYDKIVEGCPIGGNLSTLISNKTKDGGAIVWGGIRDYDQIVKIENTQTYYRDTDPTPFMESMLLGINIPARIGRAVCMPGDVVLGTPAGIIFIPAHLAEYCVVDAEKSHVRDIWGFTRLDQMKYSAAQIDSPWEPEMWEDFTEWFAAAPEAAEYRHLNFEEELAQARSSKTSRKNIEAGEHKEETRW
jgi:regulator of RNase E activity RraA